MRIVVTGATGFLGRHIVQQLSGDHDIVCLSRSGSAPDGCTGKRVDVVKGRGLKAAFAKADVVIHAAGMVSHLMECAKQTWDVHVTGTRNVMEAATSAKFRVVLVSTSGTIAVSTDPDAMATEEDPAQRPSSPAWPYYRSKLYAEQLALANDGPDVICLNPSLLGPGDDPAGASTHAVRVFLDQGIPVSPSEACPLSMCATLQSQSRLHVSERSGERYLLSKRNALRRVLRHARADHGSGCSAPGDASGHTKLSRGCLGWVANEVLGGRWSGHLARRPRARQSFCTHPVPRQPQLGFRPAIRSQHSRILSTTSSLDKPSPLRFRSS